MTKASEERRHRALALRDIAFRFASSNGTMTRTAKGPSVLEVRHSGLGFLYSNTFPTGRGPGHYLVVDDDEMPSSKNRRRLCVVWTDEGESEVRTFKPGDWQERLLKLVRREMN
ncbi:MULTISPECIES: hypothetical protein [unclassified Bradyrhizobium]|nr:MULTISPECIES: hypothetical protein [unclassified Bradyrhizobium]